MSNTEHVINWLTAHKTAHYFSVEKIPFLNSKEWHFVDDKCALVHKSGRFFAIKGYRATDKQGKTTCQPLIHQWEVGIQAFIVRQREELEILLQAKTEPGNVGKTQLSPTLQVTRSNLQRVHNGKLPAFADTFLNLDDKKVWLNRKYPELSNRYYKKWNENIIIEVDDIGHDADFKWVDIKTFKELLKLDNIVNNDARLVGEHLLFLYDQTQTPISDFLAMLLDSWNQLTGFTFASSGDAVKWLQRQKENNQLIVDEIPLTQMKSWTILDDAIDDSLQYSVIQIVVASDEREVDKWDQPIINSHHLGLLALICKKFNGVLNILFEASPQIGNQQGAELLPSVSFDGKPLNDFQLLLKEIVETASECLPETIISEEGGRFYQDESVVKIVITTEELPLPDNYCWLTLGQIRELNGNPHVFSDETRSALAVLVAHL